jgi:hypothetical protein
MVGLSSSLQGAGVPDDVFFDELGHGLLLAKAPDAYDYAENTTAING